MASLSRYQSGMDAKIGNAAKFQPHLRAKYEDSLNKARENSVLLSQLLQTLWNQGYKQSNSKVLPHMLTLTLIKIECE